MSFITLKCKLHATLCCLGMFYSSVLSPTEGSTGVGGEKAIIEPSKTETWNLFQEKLSKGRKWKGRSMIEMGGKIRTKRGVTCGKLTKQSHLVRNDIKLVFPYWKIFLAGTKATFFSRAPSGPLSIPCLALSKVWVLKALKCHFMRKRKRGSEEFCLRDQGSQYGFLQPLEENLVYLYSRANNSPWALSTMAEFVIVQLGGRWGRRKGEGRGKKCYPSVHILFSSLYYFSY